MAQDALKNPKKIEKIAKMALLAGRLAPKRERAQNPDGIRDALPDVR